MKTVTGFNFPNFGVLVFGFALDLCCSTPTNDPLLNCQATYMYSLSNPGHSSLKDALTLNYEGIYSLSFPQLALFQPSSTE